MTAQHEAGPATDHLIAERVMGWTWGQTGEDYDGWVGAPRHAEPLPRRADRGAFRPSTSIADAWMVVERLVQLGHGSEVYNNDTGGWSCIFGPHAGDADTAPLAICRAALAAVGA